MRALLWKNIARCSSRYFFMNGMLLTFFSSFDLRGESSARPGTSSTYQTLDPWRIFLLPLISACL